MVLYLVLLYNRYLTAQSSLMDKILFINIYEYYNNTIEDIY